METILPFTQATSTQYWFIMMLFMINAMGTWQLSSVVHRIRSLQHTARGVLTLTREQNIVLLAYPIMIFYAIGFAILPLLRYWSYCKEKSSWERNIRWRTTW